MVDLQQVREDGSPKSWIRKELPFMGRDIRPEISPSDLRTFPTNIPIFVANECPLALRIPRLDEAL